MSDGRIVYEVRVDSSRLPQDLSQTEEKLQNTTTRLASISRLAAQNIGNVFSSILSGQGNRVDTLLLKLADGFSRLTTRVNPLKAVLTPIADLLARIGKTDLSGLFSGGGGGKILQSVSGGAVTRNSHRDGKDYIPFDEYPALLHKGEAVLTAAENEILQASGGIMGLIQNQSPQPIFTTSSSPKATNQVSSLNQTLNIHVELDGYQVAKAVARSTGELNRQINTKLFK